MHSPRGAHPEHAGEVQRRFAAVPTQQPRRPTPVTCCITTSRKPFAADRGFLTAGLTSSAGGVTMLPISAPTQRTSRRLLPLQLHDLQQHLAAAELVARAHEQHQTVALDRGRRRGHHLEAWRTITSVLAFVPASKFSVAWAARRSTSSAYEIDHRDIFHERLAACVPARSDSRRGTSASDSRIQSMVHSEGALIHAGIQQIIFGARFARSLVETATAKTSGTCATAPRRKAQPVRHACSTLR